MSAGSIGGLTYSFRMLHTWVSSVTELFIDTFDFMMLVLLANLF